MTQRKQTEFQHGFDRLTVKGQQQDSIEFGLRAEVAWLTGKVGELRAVLADIDTEGRLTPALRMRMYAAMGNGGSHE
jgi:hypothetical protein